jgi:hypothetical protein
MKDLGGSQFGTSFFSAEPIDNVRNDPNFTLRRTALNWFPGNTANRSLLAAMSIQNLKSFLQVFAGASPQAVRFHRPEEEADFDTPWESSPGVLSTSMDLNIAEEHIQRLTRDEIESLLKAARDSQEQ